MESAFIPLCYLHNQMAVALGVGLPRRLLRRDEVTRASNDLSTVGPRGSSDGDPLA